MEANGNGHPPALQFSHPPRRVVSLVPSLTESLCELGFGSALVGITDYCVHPAGALAGLPRLGGPKNPNIDAIIALQPDLVLVNKEENTRLMVDALVAAGVPAWMSFPQTVRQALDVLWTLTGLFHSRMAAIRLETLEMTLEWALSAAGGRPGIPYFCPIWYDRTGAGQPWWMTFNQHTYCHDVLQVTGGANVFAARERRYPLAADLAVQEGVDTAVPPPEAEDPGGRDTRYPRVSLAEVVAAQPEMILLPNEPFAFSEEHRQELLGLLAGTPAARHGRIHLVDGSLITWHGTRLARALDALPALFAVSTG